MDPDDQLPDPTENYFGGSLVRPPPPSSPKKSLARTRTSSITNTTNTAATPTHFSFAEQDVDDVLSSRRMQSSSSLAQAPSPHSALVHIQTELDLLHAVAGWPKYVCRVRNRFGALEAKLLCVGEHELRLLPLQESALVTENEESSSDDSNNRRVHFWQLHKQRDVGSLRILGFNGCWVQIVTTTTAAELAIRFESPASRSHFIKLMTNGGVLLLRTFPGGEDCVAQDVSSASAAFEFRVASTGKAQSPAPRTYSFHVADRMLYVFRAQDLQDGAWLVDSSHAFARHAITAAAVLIDVSSTSAAAPAAAAASSSSDAPSAAAAAAAPTAAASTVAAAPIGFLRSKLVVDAHAPAYDLYFTSVLERERFRSALHTLVMLSSSSMLTRLPAPLPPAKTLRLTWKPSSTPQPKKWFSLKRSLFIGTFNVGDAAVPSSDLLELWCNTKRRPTPLPGSTGITAARFSMYVFGLQECNKLDEWIKALHQHISSQDGAASSSYVQVASVKLWEMGLVVFALSTERITHVETNTVATGMSIAKEVTGVQLGNKGGVGCALRWNDTSLLFINCHLSPHQEKTKERCANFIQICNKLGFGGTGGAGEQHDLLSQFDKAFVLGDLNFRVDELFTKVVSLSSQAKFAQLVAMDQLGKEFADPDSCFRLFRDVAAIDFPPTYRWEKGRAAFSNKRDQPPSYTDRVLVYTREGGGGVHCASYSSAQDCMISDHRPVACALVVDIRLPHALWPHHPSLCQLKRDVECDPCSDDLLNNNNASGLLHVGVPVASPQAIIRKSSAASSSSAQEATTSVPASPHFLLDSKQDQDEEDEPVGPFLGEFGSYFVAPPSSSSSIVELAALPSIQLVDANLKLAIGVPTGREAVLRSVCPKIAADYDDGQAVVGGEPTSVYQVEVVWPATAAAALKVRPLIFDPHFLGSQHLLVCVEHRTVAVAVVPGGEEVSVFAAAAAAGDQGGEHTARRAARATTSALSSLRRNMPQLGSQSPSTAAAAAPQLPLSKLSTASATSASATTSTSTSSSSSAHTVIGFMAVPLAGITAHSAGVRVSCPVIHNLVHVGTFECTVKVTLGQHEDLRRQLTTRPTAAATQASFFCLRSSGFELLVEDKWKRVFVGVDCAGQVWLSLRLPTAALLSKQSLGDFLQKNASWVCDATRDTTRVQVAPSPLVVGDAKPAQGAMFELSVVQCVGGGDAASVAGDGGGGGTLHLTCAHESHLVMLQSLLDMFRGIKRYADRDFLVELQQSMKERIQDRARRRELELDIQRKNAELARKQQEHQQQASSSASSSASQPTLQPTLQSKASFISRVLLTRKSSRYIIKPGGGGGGGAAAGDDDAPPSSASSATTTGGGGGSLSRSWSQRGSGLVAANKTVEENAADVEAAESAAAPPPPPAPVVHESEEAKMNAKLRERAKNAKLKFALQGSSATRHSHD